jgi:hypothetical protein
LFYTRKQKSKEKMKMKFLKICVMIQILGNSVLAQSVEPPTSKQGITTHASVVGALIYPGLKVGADYKVIDKEVTKSKRNGKIKVFHKNRFITANLGFYYHRDYNANIFLHGGYQWQRMRSTGWFKTLEPQLGISRSFIDGTVYKINDTGGVTKKKGAGHFYLAPSLSLGIGKDLSVKNENNPFTIFTKLTLFTNMPYNNFIYVRLLGEIGVSYHLNKVMAHGVKLKYKKK